MTDYVVPLGTSGDNLVLKSNPLVGGLRVFHRGERVKRKLFAPSFTVTDSSGVEHEVRFKNTFLDSLPAILVDGEEQPYAPELPMPVKIITGSTLIIIISSFVVAGGLIGALIGLAAWWFGQSTARSIEDKTTAVLVSSAIVGVGWVLFIVLLVAALALV